MDSLKKRLDSATAWLHAPQPPVDAMPPETNPSTHTTIHIVVPASSRTLTEVSETLAALSQELLRIEMDFVDFQGEYAGLPSGSFPLADRVDNLDNDLSRLCTSTEAIESRVQVGCVWDV